MTPPSWKQTLVLYEINTASGDEARERVGETVYRDQALVMILLDIKTHVTMASEREKEEFCSEFYTEERIAAFEKLSGEGYMGSQGQAVTKVSYEWAAPLCKLILTVDH